MKVRWISLCIVLLLAVVIVVMSNYGENASPRLHSYSSQSFTLAGETDEVSFYKISLEKKKALDKQQSENWSVAVLEDYIQLASDLTRESQGNEDSDKLLLLAFQCYYSAGEYSKAEGTLADYIEALRVKTDDRTAIRKAMDMAVGFNAKEDCCGELLVLRTVLKKYGDQSLREIRTAKSQVRSILEKRYTPLVRGPLSSYEIERL